MDSPKMQPGVPSDEEKAALWKKLVAMLLQEQYVLTAFELLHELLEDGQLAAAGQLQDYFADPEKFPPDQMMQLQSMPALNIQKMSEEKEAAQAKAAVIEYELRLAKEDMKGLQQRLEQQEEALAAASAAAAAAAEAHTAEVEKIAEGERERNEEQRATVARVTSKRQMSMKGEVIRQEERRDLNCAVKEYLVGAGYKLTAMTFCDEVADQDLDQWQSGPAHVERALHTYYKEFLTSVDNNEHVERLEEEKEDFLSRLQDANMQQESLAAKIESQIQAVKDLEQTVAQKDTELLHLKERSEAASREVEVSQANIAALHLELKELQLRAEAALSRNEALELEKAAALQEAQAASEQAAQWRNRVREVSAAGPSQEGDLEATTVPATGTATSELVTGTTISDESAGTGLDDESLGERRANGLGCEQGSRLQVTLTRGEGCAESMPQEGGTHSRERKDMSTTAAVAEQVERLESSVRETGQQGATGREATGAGSSQVMENGDVVATEVATSSPEQGTEGEQGGHWRVPTDVNGKRRLNVADLDKNQLEELRKQLGKEDEAAVVIIAEALPNIIPNVLINRRDELVPLITCAIERHPDPETRDSLTHGLFNLIKKPDEDQRRMIMDACIALAEKVGEERTEKELLPQCWEQINHKFAERRVLVAQSCGELVKYVKPSTRSSLILSIVEQLTDDPEPAVREEVAQNLALLLVHIDDIDKYSKLEDLTFRLVCDPAGEVVEESLQRLVPALLSWAKAKRHPLSHLLRALLQRILANIQHCPPASGVEGSPEANLRVLGERERWSIDVLLRMLTDLLPEVRHAAVKTCPPGLKEGLENGIGSITEEGDSVFSEDLLQRYASLSTEVHWPALDWVVDDCLPAILQLACMLSPREEVLRLRLCKVFLSICGVFGRHYTESLLLPVVLAAAGYPVDATGMPVHLSSKLQEVQPSGLAGERLARMCVLPLLFAGVLGAPGFREKTLAEYLRELVLSTCLAAGPWNDRETPDLIDAVRFLCTQKEHHEAILAVLWELVVNPTPSVRMTAAVLFQALAGYVDVRRMSQQVLPALVTLGSDSNLDVKNSSIAAFGAVALHFKDEMIVEKIRIQMESFLEDGSQEAALAVVRALTAAVPVTTSSLRDSRREERAEILCTAIRALDRTDLSSTSVQNYLLPTVQALLKEPEALSPSSREDLDGIMRERGGVRLEAIGKAMGKSLFGEGGLFVKKEASGDSASETSTGSQPPPVEESRLRRMMRVKYEEMLRGGSKTTVSKQITSG